MLFAFHAAMLRCLRRTAKQRHKCINSVYECCSYLCLSQALMCCNSFWPRLVDGRFVVNKWSRLYSTAVATLIIGIVAYAAYVKAREPVLQQRLAAVHKLPVFISAIELSSSVLVYAITVVSMQFTARRHLKLYACLHELDECLRQNFAVDLHYHKLRRKNIGLMTFLGAVYFPAVYTVLLKTTYAGDLALSIVSISCYMVVCGAPHFHCYVHINYIEMLRIRFRLLQKLLSPAYLRRCFPVAHQREQRISCLVGIVKRLHWLMRDLSEAFRWSLNSSQLHDFTLTTSELYLIFDSFVNVENGRQDVDYLLISMQIFAPLWKLIMLPIYCQLCVSDGSKCLTLAERLDYWFPESQRVHEVVSDFLSWRLQNGKHFHFIVGMPNLTAITAAMFNYIFILVQFRMTEQMGAAIEQQKAILQEWLTIN